MQYGVFTDAAGPTGKMTVATFTEYIQAELFARGGSHDGHTWAVETYDGTSRTIVTSFRNGRRSSWSTVEAPDATEAAAIIGDVLDY